LGASRVKRAKMERWSPYPGITPEKLGRILVERKAGDLSGFAELLADVLERDDKCVSAAPKRRQSVSRHGWEIVVPKRHRGHGKKAAAQRHVDLLEDFFNHITVSHTLDHDTRGGMALLVRQ